MRCCFNKTLVPFIGAGISVWCYPTWNNLLNRVVKENFPEKCANVVARTLDCKEKPVFDSDEEKNEKVQKSCYPSIFSYSYKDLNRKYSLKKLSWLFRAVQAKLKQLQRELDGQNNVKTDVSIPDIPMLLKVHGSIEQANSIALSRANYDEAYGGEMSVLFEQIYKNSMLVFMGCRLCEDRILDVMKTLKEKYPASQHFTFYLRPSRFEEEETK